MAKLLKDIIGEVYAPKPKGERRFVAKHKVQKHSNRVGDLDPKARVKMYNRELEHGYNPGSDAKVYEALDEGTHSLWSRLTGKALQQTKEKARIHGERMSAKGEEGMRQTEKMKKVGQELRTWGGKNLHLKGGKAGELHGELKKKAEDIIAAGSKDWSRALYQRSRGDHWATNSHDLKRKSKTFMQGRDKSDVDTRLARIRRKGSIHKWEYPQTAASKSIARRGAQATKVQRAGNAIFKTVGKLRQGAAIKGYWGQHMKGSKKKLTELANMTQIGNFHRDAETYGAQVTAGSAEAAKANAMATKYYLLARDLTVRFGPGHEKVVDAARNAEFWDQHARDIGKQVQPAQDKASQAQVRLDKETAAQQQPMVGGKPGKPKPKPGKSSSSKG